MAAEKYRLTGSFLMGRTPSYGCAISPRRAEYVVLYAVCLLPTNSGNLQKMRWYATFLFFAENKKLITLSLFFKKQSHIIRKVVKEENWKHKYGVQKKSRSTLLYN